MDEPHPCPHTTVRLPVWQPRNQCGRRGRRNDGRLGRARVCVGRYRHDGGGSGFGRTRQHRDLARVRALSPRGVAALLYLAIAGLAVGNWFWQVGVARLGATRAGMYLYLEPLATLALAVPLLGEPFNAVTAIGGGLVLAGVYVGQRDRQT